MRPSMELPLTGFHRFNTGTPLGATTDLFTGCFFFFCAVLLILVAEDDLLFSFSSELPPTLLPRPPKNENGLALPPDFFAGDDDDGGCVGGCFFVGATAPVPPPKRLNVGIFFVAASLGFDLFALAAVALGFFFEGCVLKRLIVGLLLIGAGAGAGATVAFLLAKNGADLGLEVVLFFEVTCLDCFVDDDDAPPMPKMLSVGDFFLGVAFSDAATFVFVVLVFFFDRVAPPIPKTDAVVLFFVFVSLDDDALDGFLGVAELVPKREIVGERLTTGEEVPFATAFGAAETFFDDGCNFVVFSADVEEAVLNESNRLMVGERFAGGARFRCGRLFDRLRHWRLFGSIPSR